MNESHAEPAHGHGDAHPHPKYTWVLLGLLVLTGVSFFMSENLGSPLVTWLFVLAMALGKTTLVASYFMHLKFEGKWKFVLLIPPTIMAFVLLLALMPDIGRLGQ